MVKKLGNFVINARIKNKMTQKQLGNLLKLGSSQFISNIERNLARIPISKVNEYAKILKVKERDLLEVVVHDKLIDMENDYHKNGGKVNFRKLNIL